MKDEIHTQYKNNAKLYSKLFDMEDGMIIAWDIEVDPHSISQQIIEEFGDKEILSVTERELLSIAQEIISTHSKVWEQRMENIKEFERLKNSNVFTFTTKKK